MPDGFSRSSACTIIRSPALNAPSSHSAPPSRTESCSSRWRIRSLTSGRRSPAQGLSPSRILTVTSSRIGGSTVLIAANIHAIARARAFASSGNNPACRSAIWNTIAPDSNRARSPSSYVGICPKGCSARCAGCFIAANDTSRTSYRWPASSSAQRTRMSRASPWPRSGDRSNAVMTGIMGTLLVVTTSRSRLARRIDLPQLALDFPLVAVQGQESLRQLQRVLHRIGLEQRVAADHFLGFGERTVRNRLPAVGQTHALAIGGRPQPRGIQQRSVRGHLGHQLAHVGHQLFAGFLAGVLLHPDQGKESHRRVSSWTGGAAAGGCRQRRTPDTATSEHSSIRQSCSPDATAQ